MIVQSYANLSWTNLFPGFQDPSITPRFLFLTSAMSCRTMAGRQRSMGSARLDQDFADLLRIISMALSLCSGHFTVTVAVSISTHSGSLTISKLSSSASIPIDHFWILTSLEDVTVVTCWFAQGST